MAQSTVSVNKFSGLETENWRDFESLIRSAAEVIAINNDQKANFLKLHLKDSALQFYLTLEDNIKTDFEESLKALKNHYCNPHLREIHIISLENLRFDPKKTTPEAFLVKVQTLAKQAYPDPILEPVRPAEAGDGEADRVTRETAANEEKKRFADRERERQVIRIFKKSMPNWIRFKLLDQPEDKTAQELCTVARKNLIMQELCPLDEVTRDAFSEVNTDITEKLVEALAKIGNTQSNLENQIQSLAKQVDEKIENVTKRQSDKDFRRDYNRDYNKDYNRGYNNRGNYKGSWRGSNNYRGQNFRGRGQYNGNFSRGGQRFTNHDPQQSYNQNYQDSSQAAMMHSEGGNFNNSGHIEQTEYSVKYCFNCGYPNHLARDCTRPSNSNSRGGFMPFQTKN